MFKKIKTGMMIILVIGMTMLMSSAGCDNAADSGGGGDGGSSSSLIIKQPILKSANGSTLTITHDDPKEVVSGSFSISLVEADRQNPFIFSEKRGTWHVILIIGLPSHYNLVRKHISIAHGHIILI